MRNRISCLFLLVSLTVAAQSPSSILSSLGVTGITSNRTARSANMLVKTTAEGYIDSSLLPDSAASSYIGKQVYVDASYSGTNANGSLGAPYSSLSQVTFTNGLRVLLAPGSYASATVPAGVTNVYFLRDRPYSTYFPVTLSSVTATSSGIFGFSGVSLTTSSFPSGSKLLCYDGGTLSIVSGSTSVVVKDAKTTVNTSVPNLSFLDSASRIAYTSVTYPTVEEALDYLFLQASTGEAKVAGTGLVYTVGTTLTALTNGAQGTVLTAGSNGVPSWTSPLVKRAYTNGAVAAWNAASGCFEALYFPQPGSYFFWNSGSNTEFRTFSFPSSASAGDLLTWNGIAWDVLPNTNVVGYTLTSNGAGKRPSYTSTRETFAGTVLGQLAYWDPVTSLYRPLPVASTPNLLLTSGDSTTLPTWKSLSSIAYTEAEVSCLIPVPALTTNSYLFIMVGTNTAIESSILVREDPTVGRSTELAVCTASGIVARTRADGFTTNDALLTAYVRFPELQRSKVYYAKYWWTNAVGQLVGKTNTTVLSSYYLTEPTSTDKAHVDSLFSGFVWTTNVTDQTLTLTGYTGALTRVTIPSEINGRPVTTIGSYAFSTDSGTNVTSILGGLNVRTLVARAFKNHPRLESVSLSSTHIIGSEAFSGCQKLIQVDFPSAIEIADHAFASCTALQYAVFVNAIFVDSWAFYGATSLSFVYIPSVQTVADFAFHYCTSLSEVYLSSAITIAENAFSLCTSLPALSAPCAETLGPGAFAECTQLSTVDLPRVTSVSPGVFYNCNSLVKLALPQAKTFGDEVFSGCVNLTNVVLSQDAPVESLDTFLGITSGQVVVTVDNPTAKGWGNAWNGAPVVRSEVSAGAITLGGTTRTTWPTGLTLSDVDNRIEGHNTTNNAHAHLFATAAANTTGLVASALTSVTKVYNPTNANEWYEIRGNEKWTYTITGESAYDFVHALTGATNFNVFPFPIPLENATYHLADAIFYCDPSEGSAYVTVAAIVDGVVSEPANIYADTLEQYLVDYDTGAIILGSLFAHGVSTGIVVTTFVSTNELQLKADKSVSVTINGQSGTLGTNLFFSVGSATELFNPTNATMYTRIAHGDILSYEDKVSDAWVMSVFDGTEGTYLLPQTEPFFGPSPMTGGFEFSVSNITVSTTAPDTITFTGPGFTNTATVAFENPTLIAIGDRYECRLDYVGIVSNTILRAAANVYDLKATLETNTLRRSDASVLVFSNSVSTILAWTNNYGLVTQLAICDKGVWTTNDFSGVHSNDVSALDSKIVQVANYSTNSFVSAYNLASNALSLSILNATNGLQISKIYNPTNALEWTEIRGNERWTYSVSWLATKYDYVSYRGFTNENLMPYPVPIPSDVYNGDGVAIYTYADSDYFTFSVYDGDYQGSNISMTFPLPDVIVMTDPNNGDYIGTLTPHFGWSTNIIKQAFLTTNDLANISAPVVESNSISTKIINTTNTTISIYETNIIYKVSVDTPNSISNDLSNIVFDGDAEKKWELWVNYLTTNSLSTQWDGRMDFSGYTPDLTVTGQYKFVCSTVDGINIIAKQIYPTESPSPYKVWTGTITPMNGTATVTYAHGNMPRLMITSPTVITLDPTGYGTNGVSRISLSLFSGTNSVTLATNVITYATTPTISTNCWNTILIRRVSNCAWKGVGL